MLRREEGPHLNDHRPHAKRPQCAPLQSYIEANRKTLQSACRPWLERLPDAWCWRRRSIRTGQWQLPSRRANQESRGPRPLHQCVGKESSRQPLKKRRGGPSSAALGRVLIKSRCLLSGVKRKCAKGTGISPFDPRRTSQCTHDDMHQIGCKSEDRATGRGNRDAPMRASRSRKLVRQT